MNTRSIAMMAAMLAVGLIVGIGPAQAKTTSHSAQSRTRTIDVHTHYTEPAGSMDGAQCSGLATFTPECRLRYVGTATEMQP